MAIAAIPPTTPPTIAPIGVDDDAGAAVGVGVGVGVGVVESGVGLGLRGVLVEVLVG